MRTLRTPLPTPLIMPMVGSVSTFKTRKPMIINVSQLAYLQGVS